MPGKRDPLGHLDQLPEAAASVLRAKLPQLKDDSKQPLVSEVEANQIYLNHKHPKLRGPTLREARDILRDWLLEHESVAAAMTHQQLRATKTIAASDSKNAHAAHTVAGLPALGDRMRAAFHPDRSGDVVFILAPYQNYPQDYSATHGSPWKYDTHVPLAFLRRGWQPQTVSRLVQVNSVAPTIAKLLGVARPSACRATALPEVVKRIR